MVSVVSLHPMIHFLDMHLLPCPQLLSLIQLIGIHLPLIQLMAELHNQDHSHMILLNFKHIIGYSPQQSLFISVKLQQYPKIQPHLCPENMAYLTQISITRG